MKKLLGYMLSSLLLLAGCQSLSNPTTGTTTVSGQVVDDHSQQPVPNATVQVWHASTGGGYGRVGSGYPADAQGKFAFAFEATSASGYIVLATAPPGYITNWLLGPSLTAGRKNENVTIPTIAPAWVRLQLVNSSGLKRYEVVINGYSGSGETIYNPKDTVLVRPLLAGKSSISWGIVDQATGILSGSYQDINPGALDTVTVCIPF